jgi:tetratricopeptide (TPR) repeat protein
VPRPQKPNRHQSQPLAGAPSPAQVRIHQIKARVAPLLKANQCELAASLLEDVLPLDRRDPVLHKMLGGAYMGLQNTQKALLHLRTAAELGLVEPETLLSLASIYKESGDLRSSMRVVERVLKDAPGHASAARFKAFLLRTLGESEKALAWIDSTRERIGPHPETTILRAELLVRFKRYDEAEAELRSVLDDPGVTDHLRRDALYDLGALFDKTERFADAFEAIDRANRMLPEAEVVSPELFRERWTREAIEAVPSGGDDSDRPVFVVGMPRSGTTLTEQIIAAHPSAATVGESPWMNTLCRNLLPRHLNEARLGTIARTYLAETAPRAPAGGAAKGRGRKTPRVLRVVDKMPENYYFLPMITRALPNARVIHCTRDPRDTGLSCFFQNFGSRLAWTRRLETIGAQIRLYREAMAIWHEHLGADILESNYERLTGDPRPGVQALLTHIGIPFDEACMAHHKNKAAVQTASVDQVRNPIYTSSQRRWKRYESHLGPLIETIGE